MKKTITPAETPASHDPEALFLKAERYVQQMGELDSDNWEYALWSSLALELLARAALANVSPALLAGADKNWSNLYYALGFTPIEEKFFSKSIPISEVLKRLSSILPEFTKEHESFGVQHIGHRNAELHSGEPAFDGITGSKWQPRFYQTCEVLLISMGKRLKDFVGKDEAKVAKTMIVAAADDSAKAVIGEVAAHKKVWLAKPKIERKTLDKQAVVWAIRQTGHRVDCPACKTQALLNGEPVSAPTQRLKYDVITETQEYLPAQFECISCGLKILGLSRLSVVGLGDMYKKKRHMMLLTTTHPNTIGRSFKPTIMSLDSSGIFLIEEMVENVDLDIMREAAITIEKLIITNAHQIETPFIHGYPRNCCEVISTHLGLTLKIKFPNSDIRIARAHSRSSLSRIRGI